MRPVSRSPPPAVRAPGMSAELAFLCGEGHRAAIERRGDLPFIAAGLARSGMGTESRSVAPDTQNLRAKVSRIADRTVCLTLLAGAGSRWTKSLRDAKSRAKSRAKSSAQIVPAGTDAVRTAESGVKPSRNEISELDFPELDFPEDAPRGLYPVRNRLDLPGKRVPVAAYSLDAVRDLGRHLIVVRGWEREIRADILDRLGIAADRVDFFTQESDFRGKPAGHGDAAWQCRELWRGSDYVIANFGGDANSPLTVLAGLIALDALVESGEQVDFLMPVALAESPPYPVRLDGRGLPYAFGHDKLGGAQASGPSGRDAGPASGESANTGLPPGMAYTNVGLRLYRAEALYEAAAELREKFWTAESGYAIPGNDPEGREFALDNVDALLAERGRARILAIARPEELTPAKSWDDIPAFEKAVAKVRGEWDSWNLKARFRTAL